MWMLGCVQGPNVTLYSAQGSKRENMGEFAKAVAWMLHNGWEPMSAGDSNLVVVWFRKQA